MAPPRRPVPHLWSQAEVDDAINRHVLDEDAATDNRGGLSAALAGLNDAMSEIRELAFSRNPEQPKDEAIPVLASIAVLEALGRWCHGEAEARVMELRDASPNFPWCPVPWSWIAAATGYNDGAAAGARFDQKRRQRRAEAARSRRRKGPGQAT